MYYVRKEDATIWKEKLVLWDKITRISVTEVEINIVVYLLKARPVELERQLLLENGPEATVDSMQWLRNKQ